MCRKWSKTLNSFATLFVVIKVVYVTDNPSFDNFLFGDGRFEDNPEDVRNTSIWFFESEFEFIFCIFQQLHEKDTTKHKSSSVEDLMRLFETEKYLVQTLKNSYSFFDGKEVLQEAIQKYLSSIDYDE